MSQFTRKQLSWARRASAAIGVGRIDILRKAFPLAVNRGVSPLVAACALYASGLAIHVRQDRDGWNLRHGAEMAESLLEKHPHLASLSLQDLIAPEQEQHVVVMHSLVDGEIVATEPFATSSHDEAEGMFMRYLHGQEHLSTPRVVVMTSESGEGANHFFERTTIDSAYEAHDDLQTALDALRANASPTP